MNSTTAPEQGDQQQEPQKMQIENTQQSYDHKNQGEAHSKEHGGPAPKKKKMRHSRQQKRERKQQQQQFPPQQKKQTQHHTSQPNFFLQDRMHGCARNSKSTKCTNVEYIRNHPNPWSMRVVTSCSLYESKRQFPLHMEMSTTFRIQPLLVLDLNGILCHRSRNHREPPGVVLRPPIGNVARTPVIPRGDLADLLGLLDRYFCLAVWTSAQRKTARILLDMLVPRPIQQRLLFVWTQNECHSQFTNNNNNNNAHDYNDIIFEKHLPKIWKAFPLWNANNTLLIDDSPDKCPYAVGNAIHPPPLHGQSEPPRLWLPEGGKQILWRPDCHNEAKQYTFFQQLIHHWHMHPYEQPIICEGNNDHHQQYKMQNRKLHEFLMNQGSGHMGWRGGHEVVGVVGLKRY